MSIIVHPSNYILVFLSERNFEIRSFELGNRRYPVAITARI
jgi:hypothetical protein